MRLTKPAGVFVQLIGALFTIGGAMLAASGSLFPGLPAMTLGVGLLILGRIGVRA